MRFSTSALLAMLALAYTAATQDAPITSPTLGADPFTGLNLPESAYGASLLAYLYGCPLLVAGRRLATGFLAAQGTNKFHASPGLKNGSTYDPGANVDTIYGDAYIDLAAQDVVVTIPPMQSDRYYSFSFYDLFSDDFSILSSLYNNPAGKYLVRPALKTGRAGISTVNCTGYVGCIDSPVLNPYFLARVLVKYLDNQTDTNYVKKYLKSIKITAVNTHAPTAPPLQQSDFQNLDPDNVTAAFQLTARLADRNPPQDTLLATFAPFMLLAAGISNSTYTPDPSVNLTAINQDEIDITNAFIASPVNLLTLSNGWTTTSPRWEGGFQNGTNLVARAFLGRGRFGNPTDQAIYVQPAQLLYTLAAQGEAYILQFSGKPPINTRVGFWSLTMYNNLDQFVNNPQNVQALGDRSNMTYPNGAPIYRGGNPATNDPFQILIQPYDQTPPANWTNNWLPSPTGGASFIILLRLYAPLPSGSNGQYIYPKMTKINALT